MSALPRTAAEVEDGYRACEALTRTHAGNFYYGIRLLPREPAEQIIEVVVVLADRQWAEVAVDLACLEKAAHARDERARDRRCLRRGRGGDDGHAAARILGLACSDFAIPG